jgi:protein SCO1/2
VTAIKPPDDEAGEPTGPADQRPSPGTQSEGSTSAASDEQVDPTSQEGAVITDESPDSSSPSTTPPQRTRSNRPAYLLIGLAALGLLAVNVARWVSDSADDSAGSPEVTITEPGGDAVPRPAFTLTDVDGKPFDFAAQTGGQLTFLFFGYTNCPDICPIQMATLTAALAEMPDVSAQVVFVTTDPARDDPERLRSWLTNFERPIVGLTGTPEQVAAAQGASRVTVAVTSEPDASGKYEVGHAASVLIYTPDDLLRASLPSGTTQTEWTSAIRQLTSAS